MRAAFEENKDIIAKSIANGLTSVTVIPPGECITAPVVEFKLPDIMIDYGKPLSRLPLTDLLVIIPTVVLISKLMDNPKAEKLPRWGNESKRTPWWPVDCEWLNPRCEKRDASENEGESAANVCRRIITAAYRYHNVLSLTGDENGLSNDVTSATTVDAAYTYINSTYAIPSDPATPLIEDFPTSTSNETYILPLNSTSEATEIDNLDIGNVSKIIEAVNNASDLMDLYFSSLLAESAENRYSEEKQADGSLHTPNTTMICDNIQNHAHSDSIPADVTRDLSNSTQNVAKVVPERLPKEWRNGRKWKGNVDELLNFNCQTCTFINVVAKWTGSCLSNVYCDSGYGCSSYLLTPYLRSSNLGQERNNRAHTSRVQIEMAFGK
ncbi:uncharacterized protein LOC141912150 [Tubulanus polymorphus]|uniref:uncharacterized protein LOC141912150 n=1 Tax=Tubulanus polymorphus TaxID=672921 RepID=UPI003DA30DB5